MASISELVKSLKEGLISKEQLLQKIDSPLASNCQTPERPFTVYTSDIETNSEMKCNFDSIDSEYLQTQEEPRRPPMMTSQSSTTFINRPSNFLRRQDYWESIRSYNHARLQGQAALKEFEECTFRPKVNTDAEVSEKVFSRLYRVKDVSHLLKIKTELEKAKQEAELSQCTFKPSLNPKSSCVSSRLLESSTKNLSPRFRIFYEDSCTFAPKVRGLRKGMSAAKHYLEEDPFERLYKPKQAEPEEEVNPSRSMSKSVSKSASVKSFGDSFSSRPFFERQALYELMKKEKREAAYKRPPTGSVMCERSKKLVKKDFYERNQELLERKKFKVEQALNSTPLHKPKLTKRGKSAKPRGFKEMCYGDPLRKQEKISQKKEEAEQQVEELHRPHFSQNKSYSNVSSRLNLIGDPSSYVQRIKEMARQKERQALEFKESQEQQELSQCTHAPRTIDAPSYVKQIARNMAMLKAERSVNQVPSKPEWR